MNDEPKTLSERVADERRALAAGAAAYALNGGADRTLAILSDLAAAHVALSVQVANMPKPRPAEPLK